MLGMETTRHPNSIKIHLYSEISNTLHYLYVHIHKIPNVTPYVLQVFLKLNFTSLAICRPTIYEAEIKLDK